MGLDLHRKIFGYPTALLSGQFLAVVVVSGSLTACTQEQIGAIQNPQAGLLELGDKIVGTFQSPKGQVTVTENSFDGKGRISFFNTDGSQTTGVIGPLRGGQLLGPWSFPGETDAVVQGATPGCQVQTMFVGVTYNHVQVTHIPQCGQFRFEPGSNGVRAIQVEAADPEVFLFQGSQMQGPELYSQLTGQPAAPQSSYQTHTSVNSSPQKVMVTPPPSAPPVDDTSAVPSAATEQTETGNSAQPNSSLNLLGD